MSCSMEPTEGALRIWWVPQAPMDAFHFGVPTPEHGGMLLAALAEYDEFQYDHMVKPDYCNAGGLEVFEDGEWCEWHDPETDMDESDLSREDPTWWIRRMT